MSALTDAAAAAADISEERRKGALQLALSYHYHDSLLDPGTVVRTAAVFEDYLRDGAPTKERGK